MDQEKFNEAIAEATKVMHYQHKTSPLNSALANLTHAVMVVLLLSSPAIITGIWRHFL